MTEAKMAPLAAQDKSVAGSTVPAAESSGAIVVTRRQTRSVESLEATEIQKILPGISPLKAIQTLPDLPDVRHE